MRFYIWSRQGNHDLNICYEDCFSIVFVDDCIGFSWLTGQEKGEEGGSGGEGTVTTFMIVNDCIGFSWLTRQEKHSEERSPPSRFVVALPLREAAQRLQRKKIATLYRAISFFTRNPHA
ncbi:MAG: hypothetical protein DSM106950_15045 [Stigonema ocellatum SAG 48.90 = DSM 106950]|nr:hypothetical protein [Stigonema ocellatum SAG 48.90 = DSM 106950]